MRRENPTLKEVGSDEDSLPAMIEFLRIHGDERWFLYLHLMDVHEYIYDSESALFGTDYSDVYDNSIRYVDDTLARLYRVLFEAGELEQDVIAVVRYQGPAANGMLVMALHTLYLLCLAFGWLGIEGQMYVALAAYAAYAINAAQFLFKFRQARRAGPDAAAPDGATLGASS